MSNSDTQTSTDTRSELVDEFLSIVESGRGGDLARLYAPDVVVDRTVPNWRYSTEGAQASADEYARWFADEGQLEESRVIPTETGAVVTYLLRWEEDGVPHAGHHCHVLDIENGRIVRDTVWCGGRWPADLLAQMEDAANGG